MCYGDLLMSKSECCIVASVAGERGRS
jgi:hypothetical protein